MGDDVRVNDDVAAQTADRSDDDAVLLNRFRAGDKNAYRHLLNRHLPRVLRIAERLTGQPTDAEDIAQEAMVRLWKVAQTWDVEGAARIDTWLYRVTVNLCIDRSRKKKFYPLDQLPEHASLDKGALLEVHSRQIHTIVCDLLGGLSKSQRLVLVLSYYEGLPSTKIAEIMEITPGAVSALLHRGRKALKAMLTEKGIWGWSNEENDG